MMRFRYFAFFFLMFLSCSLDRSVTVEGRILFPLDGATVTRGTTLALSADVTGGEAVWHGLDGDIVARGESCAVIAGQNISTLRLFVGMREVDSISLVIVEPSSEISRVLYGQSLNIPVIPGDYLGFFVSFGPAALSFDTVISNPGKGPDFSTSMQKDSGKLSFLRNDVRVGLNTGTRELIQIAYDDRTRNSPVFTGQHDVVHTGEDSESRDFFVADITGDNNGVAWIRTFRLLYSGNGLRFWVDGMTGDTVDTKILEMAELLSALFYPRVVGLFGTHGDVNSDGFADILFTPLLNDSGIVIGFLNPNDLFARISSNPYSNEGEVIYAGIPESGNFSFSQGSLMATIIHEITHLIHFYNRTYREYERGNPDPPVADLFLDEGLAHLSESLCGLGASGGNIGFYSVYLSNAGNTSLVGRDVFGRMDSTAKRGGMSGFLSWVFRYAGGAIWENDGSITDTGGAAFLKKLVSEKGDSWSIIGSVLGVPTHSLFLQWVNSLVFHDEAGNAYDPITFEPLSLDPHMGSFEVFPGLIVELKGISPVTMETRNWRLLPYSMVPLSLVCPEEWMNLNVSSISGDANARVYLKRELPSSPPF